MKDEYLKNYVPFTSVERLITGLDVVFMFLGFSLLQ